MAHYECSDVSAAVMLILVMYACVNGAFAMFQQTWQEKVILILGEPPSVGGGAVLYNARQPTVSVGRGLSIGIVHRSFVRVLVLGFIRSFIQHAHQLDINKICVGSRRLIQSSFSPHLSHPFLLLY